MELFPDRIRPENYQRAFFFKRLGYLLMDIVFSHYRKRDFLAIYNNEMLGTYIGNEAADWTSENGKEIFSSKENFNIFEAGFRENIRECEEYIGRIKNLKESSVGNFFDHRAMIDKTYYFFEKTEFFFTDSCYYGEMSETLKKNLFILGDDLKMKSRPLFVEVLTTCLYHLVDLLARQTAVSPEDIKFYSFNEVISLIETKSLVSADILLERKKSYVLFCENERVIPIEGEQKALILKKFKEPDYSKMNEFKGVIANKGKVTAKIRVIVPELDQSYEIFVKKLHSLEMDGGEILVTETTSPDFVPLMKKAGGIIANQGGLNSHAAIMSRELGVPCLVGTYHATEILKTGDLVELDAESGIVKILEKSNS